MHISFFYNLCHPLPLGLISYTTWSVPIAHYCLPYELHRAWLKRVKLVCLANKSMMTDVQRK